MHCSRSENQQIYLDKETLVQKDFDISASVVLVSFLTNSDFAILVFKCFRNSSSSKGMSTHESVHADRCIALDMVNPKIPSGPGAIKGSLFCIALTKFIRMPLCYKLGSSIIYSKNSCSGAVKGLSEFFIYSLKFSLSL